MTAGLVDVAAPLELRAVAALARLCRPDAEALKHFGSWPDGIRETPLVRI